jgi:hypothetical protein
MGDEVAMEEFTFDLPPEDNKVVIPFVTSK